MPKQMICQYDSCHRLYDRYRSGHDTRVMPAFACHRYGFTGNIHRFLFWDDGCNGFEGYPEGDVHAIGDPALYATGMIAFSFDRFAFFIKNVVMLRLLWYLLPF